MGNFSRNTFKPEKNYVGVRLQQGVPLVDADWNELNDIGRHELYNGLSTGFRDGVGRVPGNPAIFSFWVQPVVGTQNDFYFLAGDAIVGGRPVRLPPAWRRYSQQPWTNAAKAAQDGVAVIPPLTTPGAARSDVVYLDVWEREVGQAEDGEIVNPVIGVETAVRLKREVAVRVAEGTTTLPSPPAGHRFMRLAILNRAAGGAEIQALEVEERRPLLDSGPHERPIAISPLLPHLLGYGYQPWEYGIQGNANLVANKPASVDVVGYAPISVPHGARLTKLQVRGQTGGSPGNFVYALIKSVNTTPPSAVGWILTQDTVTTMGAFDRTTTVPTTAPGNVGQNMHVVDNAGGLHWLIVVAGGSGLTVTISGITLWHEA